MHCLYVKLCKKVKCKQYLIVKLLCIYKDGKYDSLKIYLKLLNPLWTSQNNALWVWIHEKSREVTLREKCVYVIN